MKVFDIAARDLRSYFLSPLSWIVLAVVQLVAAWFMLVLDWTNYIYSYSRASPQLTNAPGITQLVVTPLIHTVSFACMFLVPMMTMRSISAERHSGSLTLLLSAPVSMTEIVLGKYLAILGYLVCLAGLVTLTCLSLLAGGKLDMGLFGAALLGFVLTVACFGAAGLFFSTLTAYPAVAAVSSFGFLILMWLLGMAGSGTDENVEGLLAMLSFRSHLEHFLTGLVETQDLLYFALFVVTFVSLSIRRLDTIRLSA